MISIAAARRLILGGIAPLGPCQSGLGDAAGLVAAQSVRATEEVPRFANSAMDGYAVRAADVVGAPVLLRVAGAAAAGDGPRPALRPGEAVRIMTGALLPDGADAVCIVEHTSTGDDGATVRIEEEVRPGANVRRPGEDIALGAEVCPAGTPLSPARLGVLASLGVRELFCYPRPTVGVLSTGNELATPGDRLGPGKIRDANGPALLAQLRADGFRGIDLGIGEDDETLLADHLQAAAERCDAIVATGGVSVGDHDLLKTALQKLGGPTMHSLRVAMKPGQHIAVASVGERRVPAFGLPGNPVAALVAYEMFVRPALRAMAGYRVLDRARLAAVAEAALPRRPGRKVHFVRVLAHTGADGLLRVRPSGGQDSHMLWAMAQANALALLPDGPGVQAGERVEVLLLDTDALYRDDASFPAPLRIRCRAAAGPLPELPAYREVVALIRLGAAADIDSAVAVYERSNLARRQGVWPGQAARADHVRVRLRDSGTWFLVATEGPETIAMASARDLREKDGEGPVIPGGCFLGFLYVVPERWGRGIGGAVLDALIAEAKRRHYSRIHLLTHADNERSQRLYRSRGFSPTGRGADGQGEWAREI